MNTRLIGTRRAWKVVTAFFLILVMVPTLAHASPWAWVAEQILGWGVGKIIDAAMGEIFPRQVNQQIAQISTQPPQGVDMGDVEEYRAGLERMDGLVSALRSAHYPYQRVEIARAIQALALDLVDTERRIARLERRVDRVEAQVNRNTTDIYNIQTARYSPSYGVNEASDANIRLEVAPSGYVRTGGYDLVGTRIQTRDTGIVGGGGVGLLFGYHFGNALTTAPELAVAADWGILPMSVLSRFGGTPINSYQHALALNALLNADIVINNNVGLLLGGGLFAQALLVPVNEAGVGLTQGPGIDYSAGGVGSIELELHPGTRRGFFVGVGLRARMAFTPTYLVYGTERSHYPVALLPQLSAGGRF